VQKGPARTLERSSTRIPLSGPLMVASTSRLPVDSRPFKAPAAWSGPPWKRSVQERPQLLRRSGIQAGAGVTNPPARDQSPHPEALLPDGYARCCSNTIRGRNRR